MIVELKKGRLGKTQPQPRYVTYCCAIILALSGIVESCGQSFTNANVLGIPALTNSNAGWADFNNDGLLDVFVSGTSITGVLQTSVRLNTGNNSFSTIVLSPVTDVAFEFGDYNSDGFIDIIVHGISSDQQKHSLIYRNNNGIGFTPQNFDLVPLSKGGIIWHDLDHDLDLDIVMTGLDEDLEERTVVYEYSNDAYQLVENANLISLSNGKIAVIDVDSDGQFEILLTGLNSSGQPGTHIYRVNNELAFTPLSNTLEGTAFNSMAVADFDNDQRLDFAVAGFSGANLETSSLVMVNNGFSDFISGNPGIINVSSASLSAGDLNHDGLTDLLLTGHDDDGFNYSKVYRNLSNNIFQDHAHTIPALYNGTLAPGDYDNDGDLDALIVGSSDIALQGAVFLSDQAVTLANNAPLPPTNLVATTDASQVTLSWNAATDDHTASEDLTYNVYLSTDENGQDLVYAPSARVSDGFVKIPQPGNAGNVSSITFYNLPEGRYYWSVHAVDQSFRGSAFATVQTFSICHKLSLGEDIALCSNDTLTIQAGNTNDLTDWYSKTSGLLLDDIREFVTIVTANDTLVAIVTKPFGCAARDTVFVTVNPLPSFSLGADKEICHNDEVLLEVDANIDSLNWFGKQSGLLLANAFAYSTIVVERDTLIAQAFSEHGCVSYDSIVISPLSLPQYDLGLDREVCLGQPTTLSVNDQSLSVSWSRVNANVHSGPSYELDFIVQQTDTVVAAFTDNHNCIGYDSLVISVLPLPVLDLGADRSICYNEPTTFQLPDSPSFRVWLNTQGDSLALTQNHYTHTALFRDTIIVQAIDNKQCLNRDSVIVNVLALPQFSIGSDTAICDNQNVLLRTGSGYERVDWFSKVTGNSIQNDSWFFNYHVLQTDTIIARVQNSQGCINYDSVRIEQLELPAFSLGADSEVCDGNVISLSVPGLWQSVIWSVGDNLIIGQESTLEFQPQENLGIVATVTGLNQCINADSIHIQVLPLPVFDLGLDRSVCENDVTTISITNSAQNFEWQDGSQSAIPSESSYTFTAAQSKEIHVRITDNKGCQFRDSVNIIVNPLPRFEISGDTAVCLYNHASAIVPLQDFQSINWQTAEGANLASDSLSVNLILFESATVVATFTDLKGCVFSDSVFIRVRNLPPAFAGNDTLLCYGDHVTLGRESYVNESLDFSWSPVQFLTDHLTSNPLASPEHSITYSLLVKDIYGCESTDSVFVDVNPQIIVDAGDDVSVCSGESISLGGDPTASGSRFPYVYEWNAASGSFTSAEPNPVTTPEASSLYYLFVTTGRCEVFLDSVFVSVNPLPILQSIDTYSVGAGGSVQLNASGAQTYAWTPSGSLDDASSSSPVASPLITTVYLVEGIDLNGCKDTTLVTVLVQNSIFIPSLFTPNGDGVNDTFKVFGSGAAKVSLTIFNSSGTPVYHTDDPSEAFGQGWDGTQHGKPLPNDVYVWSVDGKYVNGDAILFNGKSRGLLKLHR